MLLSTSDDCCRWSFFFFFFNDTATTEIYTLSLHDALPISLEGNPWNCPHRPGAGRSPFAIAAAGGAGERANPEHARESSHPQAASEKNARSCVRRLADG